MVERKPYRDLKGFLIEKFGCRVHKVPLDAGLTCPNRDGTLGYGGCIYCNELGSGTGAWDRRIPLREQLLRGVDFLKRRYGAEKFIAYFQSFTNTYGKPDLLKSLYDEVLDHPDVVGISVGTRPDCIDDQLLALLQSYTRTHSVWIEYGLQSANDYTLRLINRGHFSHEFLRAVEISRGRGFHIVAHIIIGLPGEGRADVIKTARFLTDVGVDGVKIHLLYIQKGNELYRMFKKGDYKPLELDEYVGLVCDFLEHLSPQIVIHRLTGDAHMGRLIAPEWSEDKQKVISSIVNELKSRKTYQGIYCGRY